MAENQRPRFISDRPDGRITSTAGFYHQYLKHLRSRLAFDPAMSAGEMAPWRERHGRIAGAGGCVPRQAVFGGEAAGECGPGAEVEAAIGRRAGGSAKRPRCDLAPGEGAARRR